MDDKNELIPALEIYIKDFQKMVVEIDEAIFVARGHAPCAGYVAEDLPKRPLSGLPNNAMAMFLTMTLEQSNVDTTNIAQFPKTLESYIFSRRGIMRMLHRIFFDPVRTGVADAHIKDMWFIAGIGMVRERVLFRKEWFPRAGQRTADGLARYAHVFGEHLFTEISQLRKILNKERPNPQLLDIKLTQYLVMKALINGYSKEEAIALIMGD